MTIGVRAEGPVNHEPVAREQGPQRTDEELLSLVAAGSQEAFHALFQRHADRVLRYAISIVRSRHLAEEVLQETMIVIWKGAKRFEGRSKATTWMLGIARNLSHNLLRKEKRGERVPDVEMTMPDPADGTQKALQVQRALDVLTDAQREVLHLVYYEEMSLAEAANVLGIPEGTVKSRMFHARKALAKELT
jgi:RNA polymerase sigma-70 factor (ECF subfamily)